MATRNERSSKALVEKGNGALAQYRFAAAEAAFTQALKLAPSNSGALTGMARIMWDRYHDGFRSYEYYHAAVLAHPEDVDARLNRAQSANRLGDIETAERDLDFAIAHNTFNMRLYAILHNQKKIALGDRHYQRLTQLTSGHLLADRQRSTAHFVLGSIHEKNKNFRTAFAHFRAANDFRAGIEDFRKFMFNRLFTHQAIAGALPLEPVAAPTPAPRFIFVVGMPRSGSTLLEQILTTRDGVGSVGEATFMRRHWLDALADVFGEKVTNKTDPGKLTPHMPAKLKKIRQSYVDDIARTVSAVGNHTIVDKQLGCFELVPLLLAMFPDARVLHCRRHPLDVGLSCYTQDFGDIKYSARLPQIGFMYRFHHEVMKAWEFYGDGRVMSVCYEDVAARPQDMVPEILAFCGLPFDQTAVDPTRSKNLVNTASEGQVNRPIYRSAMGRWQQYADELEPLAMALGGWEWLEAHAPALDRAA